ncbi:MAG: DNA gyrase subunit A, partial [Gammaproteobacteria bacterium]|nr:DNA gyrase subunit A [Gammaproteobacteria bacterium]
GQLVERSWAPGTVADMLARTYAEASRPDELEPEFGLLSDGYHLSEKQAQAILDLRLHRLTGLEQNKIIKEYEEILDAVADLLDILSNPERLMQVIKDELGAILEQYGDERRTEIVTTHEDLCIEDLITDEQVVVTLSHEGYAKSQPLTEYRAQRRGGRGKSATSMKDEDFIDQLFVANTHDTILCFSSRGKVYWKKVYEMPQAGRTARGKPIVNLLPLEEDEKINAVLPIREYDEDKFIVFATSTGTVKKTPLKDYSRPRSSGIIAIELRENDKLIGVDITDSHKDILLFSTTGKVIRFSEKDVRPMGRTATGVRGIKIKADQEIVSLIIADEKGDESLGILTATENGYGKRTKLDDYPVQGRGGQGVISIQTTERNGTVVGAEVCSDADQVMLITNAGIAVRTHVNEISVMSRNTQGVRLINLSEGEKLAGLERIVEDQELSSDSDADAGTDDTESSENES